MTYFHCYHASRVPVRSFMTILFNISRNRCCVVVWCYVTRHHACIVSASQWVYSQTSLICTHPICSEWNCGWSEGTGLTLTDCESNSIVYSIGWLQICSHKNYCGRWGKWISEVQIRGISVYLTPNTLQEILLFACCYVIEWQVDLIEAPRDVLQPWHGQRWTCWRIVHVTLQRCGNCLVLPLPNQLATVTSLPTVRRKIHSVLRSCSPFNVNAVKSIIISFGV